MLHFNNKKCPLTIFLIMTFVFNRQAQQLLLNIMLNTVTLKDVITFKLQTIFNIRIKEIQIRPGAI